MKIKITDLARGKELPEDQKRTLKPKPKVNKKASETKITVAKVKKPVTKTAKVVAAVKEGVP